MVNASLLYIKEMAVSGCFF